jgi:DNA-binding SARP family transcriptional activator
VEELNETQAWLAQQLSRQQPPLEVPAAGVAGAGACPEGVATGEDRTEVFCLGPFRLLVGGSPVEAWRPGKARALFQYLINHHDRPVSRDALVRALWPDPDALAAGTSIKVAVHALRQTLTQVNTRPAALTVSVHDAGYQLRTADLWLDVEQFERSIELARRLEAHGHPDAALTHFERAVAFYRGDFLEEAWEEWALLRREALRDQYLFALARLADAAQAHADHQACATYCQRLLEHDSCREEAYRLLMLCYARLGQRGRVRRWYELCVRALRTELDVDPEPETEALYRRALSGRL